MPTGGQVEYGTQLVQERIEGAMVAMMPQLYAGTVVRSRLLTLGDLRDLAGGNEEEHRLAIDEPADQPRTCDPVHTSPLS
jgi:hypothetical protein